MKLTPDYCSPSPSLTSRFCLPSSSIDKKIKKYRRRIRKQISKLNKEGKLSKKSSINLKKRFAAMKSTSTLKEIQNGEELRQKVARTMIRRLSFSESDSQDFIKNLRTEDFGIPSGNTFSFDESDSSIQVSECDENFLANQFAQSAVHPKPSISTFAKSKCLRNKWKVNDNLVKKVIKRARSWDVVVQVLDVRDPHTSKLSGLESLLKSQGFKGEICLVLNKADLVPEEIANSWKEKMGKHQKVFLSREKSKFQNLEQDPRQDSFLKYLENIKTQILCEKQKTKLKIGLLGLPNSGKSTVANRLFQRKVFGVGPKPGHTRAIIEKYFFQDFIIVDTPGIFDDNFEKMFLPEGDGRLFKEVPTPFEKADLNSSASKRISKHVSLEIKNSLSRECQLVLLNALSLEYLHDLMEPVDFIIRFLGKEYLKSFYNIQSFESNEDFLRKIALQQNIFSVNGEIDIFLIARMLVCHWNRGKIPHFHSQANNDFNGKYN